MTKSEVDRLGERLRSQAVTEPDLRLLDEYRLSFGSSYQEVMWVLRERSGGYFEPTGRFPKTPWFHREQVNKRTQHPAPQMQDIAGCRIVVPGLEAQDGARFALEAAFFADASSRVIDRRERPSHGYRAIHIVVLVRERAVEIQLRTALQHLWAELCEKLADGFGGEIKYGGGSQQVRVLLNTSSQRVAEIESREQKIFFEDADFDIQSAETQADRMPALGAVHQALERDRAELMVWLRAKIALAQHDRLNRGIH